MSSRMHCGPLRVEGQTESTESPTAAGTVGATEHPAPGKGRSDHSAARDDPWGPTPTRRLPSRGMRRILPPA
jgi:hypothetical protein